jgi:acetaldehyde dehydrogenase/alcohol dehydrogenase
MSKSFDNGMVCASEQAVIIDKEIYDQFVEEFKSYKTYFVNKKKKHSLKSTASV